MTDFNWSLYKSREAKWEAVLERLAQEGIVPDHSTEWGILKTRFSKEVAFSNRTSAQKAIEICLQIGADVIEGDEGILRSPKNLIGQTDYWYIIHISSPNFYTPTGMRKATREKFMRYVSEA